MANDSIPYGPTPATISQRSATASRTEDAVVKQYDRVIVEDRRVRTGVYIAHTGLHVVQAAAHAAGAGFWWLINPVNSGVLVSLRRVEFMCTAGTALATPTAPRIMIERFTFTGTASGGQVTTSLRKTTDAAAVASVRVASTGMTMTIGASVFAFLTAFMTTATVSPAPIMADWNPDTDGRPVLAPGEGLACRQPDAGTASDTRRFVTNIAWEEYTEF